jgi:RNA polymerase sigma factor (sigma-70 family)
MKHPKPTDLDLVSEIMAGGKTREKALKTLYENKFIRQKISMMVTKTDESGNIEFLDVFHDSIIIMDKNIRQNKYRFECDLFGYLYSIAKFVLLGKLRKENRNVSYLDENKLIPLEKPVAESPESIYLRKERDRKLDDLIQLLGPRTAKVLELWQLSYSMKEIAEELNLTSPNMARKLKYYGYQKLLGLVKEEELFKEWYK